MNGEVRPSQAVSLLIGTLCGLFLLLTSTRVLLDWTWPFNAKRILEFALLASLFIPVLINGRMRAVTACRLTSMPTWLAWVLVGVFIWGVISALFNSPTIQLKLNSLSEVALWAALILAVFVIAACRDVSGSRFDQLIIGLLTLTVLAVGLQELLGGLASLQVGQEFSYRTSLMYFGHPRFFNQMQSWIVPVLPALPLIYGRKPLIYAICLVALGLQWYVILMTGARGSFLSITLGSVCVAIIFYPLWRRIALWQLAGLALGTLLYTAVLISFEQSIERSTELRAPLSEQKEPSVKPEKEGFYGNEDGSISPFFAQSLGRPMTSSMGRIKMWREAGQAAYANPLLGIGPVNFSCTATNRSSHPHNVPLQILAEWGMPAFAAWLVICGYLFLMVARKLWSVSPDTTYELQFTGLLFAGLISATIHSCLSGVFLMPASQITAILIGGLLFGLNPIKTDHRTSKSGAATLAIGAVISLALITYSFVELRLPGQDPRSVSSSDVLHPRMWQNTIRCRENAGQNAVNK